MKTKVYIGVSISKHSGLTVLIGDNIAFCSLIKDDLESMKKVSEQIMDAVTLVKNIFGQEDFFACICGDKDSQKEIGKWQGVLSASGATIIENYDYWFDVMVKPHTKDPTQSRVIQSTSLAQLLSPRYSEQLGFVGFSDSFHVARFTKAIAREISDTNDYLAKEFHRKVLS